MSERRAILEWEILLDDAEWSRTESLGDLLGAEMVAPHRRTRSSSYPLWVAIAMVLLTVSVAGLHLWRVANAGLSHIDSEIRDTIDAEIYSLSTGNKALVRSLVDDEADTRWLAHFHRESGQSRAFSSAFITLQHTEIRNISLRSGLAMVEMIVKGSDGRRLREMRFYREDSSGEWLQTSPRSIFWGAKQVVETAHFRIHFRQKDAHAVVSVAARLDSIYTDLRQDAGLPPKGGKLTVEVKPLTPQQLRSQEFEEYRLVLPSPRLLQVPEELSDEEILLQSIVHPLISHMLAEVKQQTAIRLEWRAMIRGLHLWQANESANSVASWYPDTTELLYGDTQGFRPSMRAATLENLQRLCREYFIWRYAMGIDLMAHPWLCTDLDWSLDGPIAAVGPMRLSALLDRTDWDETPTWPWSEAWRQSVAAATIIDYLVEMYGRGHLPSLIAGFGEHDTWDGLVPAVLGISAQEFERGWLAYVMAQNRADGKGKISARD